MSNLVFDKDTLSFLISLLKQSVLSLWLRDDIALIVSSPNTLVHLPLPNQRLFFEQPSDNQSYLLSCPKENQIDKN